MFHKQLDMNPDYSLKKKNNRRLYLRKRFCRTTLILYLTYFGEKNRIFLVLKIKT